MSLQRSLGPIALMFTAVSGVLGSAWLFGPYYAVQIAGPAALLSWVLGGVATLLIALTFAELSCMFPIAGGSARFVHFSHGTLASFIFNWITWLGYAAVAPAETLGVMLYLASVWPSLVVMKSGIAVLSGLGYFVAALILLLMCVINLQSIKWMARYNSVVVWIKMLVPLLVAGFLLSLNFHPSHFTMAGGFMPHGINGVATALSLGGVIFAFAGYAPAIALAGEAKNPQKVIPLVLTGALGLCLLIYFILQVAFIGALPDSALSGGWANLHFAGDASPFVGMAEHLNLHGLGFLILLTAAVTPLGTAMIFITTSSRVAYAMSQNGYFPAALLNLNRAGVPYLSIILNFILGIVLFFPSPGWQGMMGFLVAAFVLCYALGPITLMAMRSQIPDQVRPFRLPFASLWCLISFYIANLIIYWTGWQTYRQMAIALLVGFVILIAMTLLKRGQNAVKLDIRHGVWALVYLIGMTLLSYYGNYGGGKGLMASGWDAVIIGIFTVIIFLWSWLSRLPAEKTMQYVQSLK